jgi:hypothetical protein
MSYKVGDEVVYSTIDGSTRMVRVTEKHADIEGGRAGFDGVITVGPHTDRHAWGYDVSILRVYPAK